MPQIEISRTIDAPAAQVWATVTDLDGAAEVISGIESLEILEGASTFGVGTRWRETRTLFGKQATEEMRVTGIDPGRSYEVTADSHGTVYLSTFTILPVDDRTSRLEMTFDAEAQSVFGKVMANTVGRLFLGATKKALVRDIDDIAAAAERAAA